MLRELAEDGQTLLASILDVDVSEVIAGTDPRVLLALATFLAAVFAAAFAFFNEWNKNRLRRKGLARVLGDDIKRLQSTLTRTKVRRTWWEDAELLKSRVDDDGITRIATALTTSEWSTVSSGLGWMETTAARRRRALERGRSDAVDEATLKTVSDTWARLEAARWSLRRLSAPVPIRIVAIRSVTRHPWVPHNSAVIRDEEAQAAAPPATGADADPHGLAFGFDVLDPDELREIQRHGFRASTPPG